MMSDSKRFEIIGCTVWMVDEDGEEELWNPQIVKILNKQQANISKLEEEKRYWKSKAMTLLMQVRRLTSRMTDKEVKEFNKELEE